MKRCKNCGACKRLYRLYVTIALQHERYYCTQREELTDRESVCEHWRKRVYEYDLSPQRLDEAEEDVCFLLRYFHEA